MVLVSLTGALLQEGSNAFLIQQTGQFNLKGISVSDKECYFLI